MVWIAREHARRLARYAVAFEPGDPARTGRMAFWGPDGGDPPALPGAAPAEAGLVTAHGRRPVPVLWLSVADALP
ncbi:hypothetical protein NGM37_12355, partial [Streptomyces sp. TRM76130]|nr:hypothetical protein [Streptomyces sp. TRM76130]